MKIYIASKAFHRPQWRQLRDEGVPIISRWIDVDDKFTADPAELDFEALWDTCVEDVLACDVLVCYVGPGEVLKGALVELGIAIGAGKQILLVGDREEYLKNGTWINYRKCDHRVGWEIDEVLRDFRVEES
jgi:nucleoside 2-deoxyribosyltransferase